MAESTSVSVVGAIVPSVKSEPVMPSDATQVEEGGGGGEEATPPPTATPPAQPTHQQQQLMAQLPARPDPAESLELDKDLLCPICMQIIKDAFLTSCGHSFCYTCIVTHLQNKSDCPCCAHFLTTNRLYPNFLLNKRHALHEKSFVKDEDDSKWYLDRICCKMGEAGCPKR